MRRYLQILLPELETLQSDSMLDYTLVNGAKTYTGQLSWSQLLKQYQRYHWLLLLAPNDTVCTTLNFPNVKKSQRDNVIKSRVQQMLLGPLKQHALCYQIIAPQNAQASWTALAPLERLQEQLKQAGVHHVHIQALAASPIQNGPDGQCYKPVAALNFARYLKPSAALQNTLFSAIGLALLVCASLWCLLSFQNTRLEQQIARLRQVSVAAVHEQWPSIPTVIAPVQQAKRALEEHVQGQEQTPVKDAIQALTIALKILTPLDIELLALGWQEQMLSLTFSHPTEAQLLALEQALHPTSPEYSTQLDLTVAPPQLHITFTRHE